MELAPTFTLPLNPNSAYNRSSGEPDILFDAETFRHTMELARTISQSTLIPPSLRGRVPDILLGLYMARMMNENPIMVLQSIQIISGRASWSAQFLIARANSSGHFRGPIRWRVEGEGEDLAVTAYATVAETGDEVAFTVSMAMARAEGWAQRNPKYKTMPELMLRYRSATLLVRLYCPDVLMGLHERDEIVDSDRGRDRGRTSISALPGELAAAAAAEGEGTADGIAEAAEAGAEPGAGGVPSAAQAILDAVRAEEERPAVMAELSTLRASHPELVRSEARKMGLSKPSESNVVALRKLIAAVRTAISALEADEDDSDEDDSDEVEAEEAEEVAALPNEDDGDEDSPAFK